MSAPIETVSCAWEQATGADSIPTIERAYDRTPGGAYVCVWPGCDVARRDAEKLWRHVHTAHGTCSPRVKVGGWQPWL